MFLLAATAAVAAIWYLRGLSQRSMDFWGPVAGELILQAPHVEALQLAGAEPKRRDISQARGLTNVRRALMQDASFDWNDRTAAPSTGWDYALRFQDGDRSATLLFAIDPPRAALQEAEEQVSTLPIAGGLRAFLEEQFVVSPSSGSPAQAGTTN
jgi:hypothetical protein